MEFRHDTYNILSLDGGGSWSLLQVKILIDLFGGTTRGHDVLRQFQLVAASSGGSIVACGLAANLPLDDLLALFLDEKSRRRLLVRVPVQSKRFPGLRPRYHTKDKLEGLRANFPQMDVPLMGFNREHPHLPHFLITAYDYDRSRAVFFRTNAESPAFVPTHSERVTFLEAVHASSTAPFVFYDEPAVVHDHRYWDGAVAGYSNPILAAVVEALAHHGERQVDPAQIRILSLGTGTVVLPGDPADKAACPEMVVKRERPGFFRDLKKLATAIVDDPPDSATYKAHVVLGHMLPHRLLHPVVTNGPVVRMNPLVQPIRDAEGIWQPPEGLTCDDFKRLTQISLDADDQSEIDLITQFGDLYLEGKIPNQGIRSSHTSHVDIGHPRYPEAKVEAAHWLKGLPDFPSTTSRTWHRLRHFFG
jgi:hypothetical protein